MLDNKMFDVEHALCMYATSFVILPAWSIYDEEKLSSFSSTIDACHIYLIGFMPQIEFVGAKEHSGRLITSYKVSGESHELEWPIPDGFKLQHDHDGYYAINAEGERIFPGENVSVERLSNELGVVGFEVLYIGQAYGTDGSRTALDRLLKHETLQKIALKEVRKGFVLTVLLLAIEAGNQLITLLNPNAKNKEQSAERISKGVDKLFDTSDAERTSLYEASLIRYFQPKYNKEFKNSFPSTNMKLLADCYDKDFSAVIAEVNFDQLPFMLFSDAVERKRYHIASHDLHTEDARKVFFSGT